MHVHQAGIGHIWSLATLPVLGQDPTVQTLSTSFLIKHTQGDPHLRVQTDVREGILSVSKDNPWLQGGAQLPSIANLISIVHAHRKRKDRTLAGHLYRQLCEYGLETDEDVGNHLVPMLVACGNLYTAQQVFEKIPYQGEHAWTSLLQGYVDYGLSHLASQAFQKMQERSVHPTTHTFVALIKACEDLRNAEKGRELHAEVVGHGYETEPFVINSLLCMYAKCGSILDVENVFDQIPVRDIVSWTALIAAYVECDLGEEALTCVEEVYSEGMLPDAVMLVCILKACASIGALDRGQIVHKEIVEEGLDVLPSVGNTLLDMYAKCGLLEEAKQLFDELPCRDTVSWTALITGYAENGLGQDAVNLLEQMQSENIISDQKMYVSSLKACCSIKFVQKGFELHGEISVEGFEVERNVANTLIDMYSKFGLLEEAQAVFDELLLADVVSWTALITGYAEHGHCDKVQHCLKQMQQDGCSPNVLTYVCSLKACNQLEALDWGRKMHAKFVTEGFENDALICGALVDMYAKCGPIDEAQAVLSQSSTQNEVSWSALIAGFAEQGASKAAIRCLEQIEDAGLSVNEVALVSSLKACSKAGALQNGYKVHNEIVKKGLETVQTCGNAVVDMYAKCGLLPEAQEVFDKLPNHDVIAWTALMAGYAEHGFKEEALVCFEEMQSEGASPDIMLWNTAMLSYAEEGEIEEALALYTRLQEQCVLPNHFSLVTILQGCCKMATIEVGRRIHVQIQAIRGAIGTEELLPTALIDMYGKCGSMAEALQVFDEMTTRSIVQWNTIITAYARQVECKLVFSTFNKMREKGVQPDAHTFSSVLFACTHGGLMREAQTYYESMVKDHGVTPHVRHDSCMVDLLGRVGCLSEAVLMLEIVPSKEDSVAWNIVLGASHQSGDVELSEQAFHALLDLGKHNSKSFVMMANIYADVGV